MQACLLKVPMRLETAFPADATFTAGFWCSPFRGGARFVLKPSNAAPFPHFNEYIPEPTSLELEQVVQGRQEWYNNKHANQLNEFGTKLLSKFKTSAKCYYDPQAPERAQSRQTCLGLFVFMLFFFILYLQMAPVGSCLYACTRQTTTTYHCCALCSHYYYCIHCVFLCFAEASVSYSCSPRDNPTAGA